MELLDRLERLIERLEKVAGPIQKAEVDAAYEEGYAKGRSKAR